MSGTAISASWLALLPYLNEVQARLYAAEKAIELGRGGVEQVHRATKLGHHTIRKGIRELTMPGAMPDPERVRRHGAGRRRIEATDPTVLKTLEILLEDDTAGKPTNALRWTHKSMSRLASEMSRLGHRMGADTVSRLLDQLHYSSQVNAKTKGKSHPDRDEQFRFINKMVAAFFKSGDPVISIDAKKKEKVGDFKNPGRTLRRSGHPIEVNTYDYPDLAIGVAIPHGTYDPKRNEGFVNVGTSHETAEFAVESIRQWWKLCGRRHYPNARRLLICADSGGSNGIHNHGWKFHLQQLTTEIGIPVTVCHYPPGTSKWNKIEHRMFSFISMNWQGIPLRNYETVINLIGHTTTKTGLRIKARLDRMPYEEGVKIGPQQLKELRITGIGAHPDWSYTISPVGARPRGHGR